MHNSGIVHQADKRPDSYGKAADASPIGNIGNDLGNRKDGLGKISGDGRKLEKKSDENWKKPEWASCAPTVPSSRAKTATEAAKRTPNPATRAINNFRSRAAIADNVRNAKSAGGCGVSRFLKNLRYFLACGLISFSLLYETARAFSAGNGGATPGGKAS